MTHQIETYSTPYLYTLFATSTEHIDRYASTCAHLHTMRARTMRAYANARIRIASHANAFLMRHASIRIRYLGVFRVRYARIRMRCEHIRIACARIRIACARITWECAHLRGTYACPVLYFTQLLTLVGAWTLLIMGSMCTFSRILWYFKILQIHWLVLGPALFTTLQPTICDESWSYLGQPLALVRAWTLLIIGSLWLFIRMPQHFEILWIQTDWWFLVLVRYLSIACNFTWILFIFSTAIGIS